jgi:hypothetical protein
MSRLGFWNYRDWDSSSRPCQKLRILVIKTVETWVLKLSIVSWLSRIFWLSRLGFATAKNLLTVKNWVVKLSRSGVLNLLLLAYPQIKIVSLCVPPNQNCIPFPYPQIKNYTQISFIWVRWAPGVPPVPSSRTPRGTRIPGWKPLV